MEPRILLKDKIILMVRDNKQSSMLMTSLMLILPTNVCWFQWLYLRDAEDLWWSSHLFCEWFNEFPFAEDIFWCLPWQTECSGCVVAWRLNTERRICTPLTIKWDAERHQNSAYWQLNSINSIFWYRGEYKRKYTYVSLTIIVI